MSFFRLLFLLFLLSSALFSVFLLSLITFNAISFSSDRILPIQKPIAAPNLANSISDVRPHGNFCVLYNFTIAQLLLTKLSRQKSAGNRPPPGIITLAVHSTLHFIHKIQEQALRWDSLISAAVLVRPGEESALSHLLVQWHCSPPLRFRLSLHLVWLRSPFQQSCGLLSARQSLPDNYPCPSETELATKEALPGSLNWRPLRYPINTLRNIARLGAEPSSRFHLVADVENVFSTNFNALVSKYLAGNKENGKIAYVVRRFEMDEQVENIPEGVWELSALMQRNLVFPFHKHHFAAGHHIPFLAKWFNTSLSSSELSDLGQIHFMNAAFEPQLILPTNAPLHFEDVPVRLYDHQVLIHELCRMGFELRLLSHIFSVHRGIRRELSESEQMVKWIGAMQSWKLLREFRSYLERKYGEEEEEDGDGERGEKRWGKRRRKCPTFWEQLDGTTKSGGGGQTTK